jgi:signal transduction histidine kinase
MLTGGNNMSAEVSMARMSPSAPAADAHEDDFRIRADLLRSMLQHTPTALTAHAVTGLVALVVLWLADAGAGMPAWYALLVAWLVARALFARRRLVTLQGMDSALLARTERQLTLLVAGSGLTWGLLPWLVYTPDNAFVNFFVVALLVGLCSGVVSSAAAVPVAMVVHLATMFLPYTVLALALGGLINWAGAGTIAFMCGVLYSFSRNTYRTMRGSLVMSYQNARLAEALRTERDTVRATMRAKDLFLAGVTHDLRQPVHALALHLSFLRRLPAEQLGPERLRDTAVPMEAALKAMSRQLTRLLELSRLEAGEVRVQRSRVDVAEVLAAVAAQFEARALDKGLAWRMRLPRGGAVLDTDARMLASIVENLVANAVRYTERGGVLLAARRRTGAGGPGGEGGALELAVFDTGVGIPEAWLAHIFEPYRRFDDRERAGDEGHGLGLALAARQAALLGSRIKVRSKPGRGSVFALQVQAPPRQLQNSGAASPSV